MVSTQTGMIILVGVYLEGFGDNESWYYLETLSALMPGDYLESHILQYKASHPIDEYPEGYGYTVSQIKILGSSLPINAIILVSSIGGATVGIYCIYKYLPWTRRLSRKKNNNVPYDSAKS